MAKFRKADDYMPKENCSLALAAKQGSVSESILKHSGLSFAEGKISVINV